MLPCPALVTRALATFQLVHADQAQATSATEGSEIGDPYHCAARRYEALVQHGWQSFPTTHVCPSSMRNYSAAGDSGHMTILESVHPAERCEVANGSDGLSIWIDESIMRLDELALPDAIRVGPSFVRLQLALAFRQSVHAGEVKVLAAAELVQISDDYGLAVRVTKALPRESKALSTARCMQIDVKPDIWIYASSALNPALFYG